MTVQDIRATHLHKGMLDRYTSIGSYPIMYLDSENQVLCPDCATESLDNDNPRFHPCVATVNWEGHDLTCDQCSEAIEAACPKEEEEEYPYNDERDHPSLSAAERNPSMRSMMRGWGNR